MAHRIMMQMKRHQPDYDYDAKKRKRGFVDAWLKDFRWLEYIKDEEKMICKICSMPGIGGQGSFVLGATSFHRESLRKHGLSRSHMECADRLNARTATAGTCEENEAATKAAAEENKAQVERLKNMFLTCHALAKHGRPFSDFVWHCDLDRSKGVAIDSRYQSAKQAKVFTEIIAKSQKLEQQKELRDANFFTIITDGSMDRSVNAGSYTRSLVNVMEQEMHFVRFAVRGHIKHICLGVQSVEKADAENQVTAIETSFKDQMSMEKNEWTKKLVGLGTDGASVKLGKTGGHMVSKLKDIQPCIVAVDCTAHRLELAFEDAMKICTSFRTLLDLLQNIHSFYHGSAFNRAMLQRAFASLKLPYIVPTHVGGTRWVCNTEKALRNFTKSYPALKRHMEQLAESSMAGVSKPKAKGFLETMMCPDVILHAFFALDVLAALNALSGCLQAKDTMMADIHEQINGTLAVLDTLKLRPGPNLQDALQKGDPFCMGFPVEATEEFTNSCTRVLENVQDVISHRFTDIQGNILFATRIGSFINWPQEQDMADFGDDDIVALVTAFRAVLVEAGVNVDLVEQEWTILKEKIYEHYPSLSQVTWNAVNSQFRLTCSNILQLIDLLLTLPSSSAETEKGFHLMKKIKNDWRSRLNCSTLSDIMCIVLHTPDVGNYDAFEAVELWNSSPVKSRRPETQPHGPKSTSSCLVNDADSSLLYDSDSDHDSDWS